MKVKNITPVKKETFEPIVLEITVESEDELLSLWGMSNVESGHIRSGWSKYNIPNDIKLSVPYCFWNVIDNMVIKLGIKFQLK